MEEKIVGNKKEGSSFPSPSFSLSSLPHLVYLSVYSVCLRSTTPLWFTDNTGSRVRFERAILDWPVRSQRKTPVEWYGLKQTTTKEQPRPNRSARFGQREASQPRTRTMLNGLGDSLRPFVRVEQCTG